MREEQTETFRRARGKTWGEVYLNALSKGFDHGYAATLADRWERRQARRLRIAKEEADEPSN